MISNPRIMIAPTNHHLLSFKRFKSEVCLIYRVLHIRHKFLFVPFCHKWEICNVMHRHIEMNCLNLLADDLTRGYLSCKSKNISPNTTTCNLLITGK